MYLTPNPACGLQPCLAAIPPNSPGEYGQDDGPLVLDREDERVKPPPRYAVYLMNDDYTPMEFVVAVLQLLFNKSVDESVAIMLKVHHEGRGVCGVYTQDIAHTRVDQVMAFATKHKHPLRCVAEPVDD